MGVIGRDVAEQNPGGAGGGDVFGGDVVFHGDTDTGERPFHVGGYFDVGEECIVCVGHLDHLGSADVTVFGVVGVPERLLL